MLSVTTLLHEGKGKENVPIDLYYEDDFLKLKKEHNENLALLAWLRLKGVPTSGIPDVQHRIAVYRAPSSPLGFRLASQAFAVEPNVTKNMIQTMLTNFEQKKNALLQLDFGRLLDDPKKTEVIQKALNEIIENPPEGKTPEAWKKEVLSRLDLSDQKRLNLEIPSEDKADEKADSDKAKEQAESKPKDNPALKASILGTTPPQTREEKFSPLTGDSLTQALRSRGDPRNIQDTFLSGEEIGKIVGVCQGISAVSVEPVTLSDGKKLLPEPIRPDQISNVVGNLGSSESLTFILNIGNEQPDPSGIPPFCGEGKHFVAVKVDKGQEGEIKCVNVADSLYYAQDRGRPGVLKETFKQFLRTQMGLAENVPIESLPGEKLIFQPDEISCGLYSVRNVYGLNNLSLPSQLKDLKSASGPGKADEEARQSVMKTLSKFDQGQDSKFRAIASLWNNSYYPAASTSVQETGFGAYK